MTEQAVVSESEKTLIRWVERLLAPILVASVVSLATCAVATTRTVDRLDTAVQMISEKADEVDDSQAELIKEMQEAQSKLIRTSIRTETKVERIEQDVEEIKSLLRQAFPANGGQ